MDRFVVESPEQRARHVRQQLVHVEDRADLPPCLVDRAQVVGPLFQAAHKAAKLAGHAVERLGKLADLILARGVRGQVQLPVRDPAGRFSKLRKRPHDAVDKERRGENSQNGRGQSQPPGGPQREPGGPQSLRFPLLGHERHVQSRDPVVDPDHVLAGVASVRGEALFVPVYRRVSTSCSDIGGRDRVAGPAKSRQQAVVRAQQIGLARLTQPGPADHDLVQALEVRPPGQHSHDRATMKHGAACDDRHPAEGQ